LLCGFAAFRAESLWLSELFPKKICGSAAEAKPRILLNETIGKPEAFRTGGGKVASQKPQVATN
jgi:hypothetical protein